jgi:hypothetical protein
VTPGISFSGMYFFFTVVVKCKVDSLVHVFAIYAILIDFFSHHPVQNEGETAIEVVGTEKVETFCR